MPPAASGEPGRTLFEIPYRALAARLAMQLSAGSEHRLGGGAELGLSYFYDWLEIGAGITVLGLWATESDFDLFGTRYPRKSRDLVLLPRVRLSAGLDHSGFWRAHLLTGVGPSWLHMWGGRDEPSIDRSLWSWTASLAFSGGVFFFEIQALGYMTAAESFEGGYFAGGSDTRRVTRDAPGVLFSIGAALPVALTASEQRPPRPAASPGDPRRCRRRVGKRFESVPCAE